MGEPCQQTDLNELCLGQLKLSWVLIGAICIAKTQYRKFETNISRKGITRPQSQYPHPCVCERFMYSHDRSAYSAAGKNVDRSLGKYKTLTGTWMWKLGLRCRNFQKSGIFVAVNLKGIFSRKNSVLGP